MASIATPEIPLKSSEHKSGITMLIYMALRVFLFATSLVAIIVMVTSKQTKMIQLAPGLALPLEAKFNQSPAFIYFVAVLSVACLHSIISGVLLVLSLKKPGGIPTKLQFQFVMFDVLLLGIVAAATGAAGGVAYIGFKGNSHTQWNKICNAFGSFCLHIASSVLISFIYSIILLLLVWLALYMLSKKIAKH